MKLKKGRIFNIIGYCWIILFIFVAFFPFIDFYLDDILVILHILFFIPFLLGFIGYKKGDKEIGMVVIIFGLIIAFVSLVGFPYFESYQPFRFSNVEGKSCRTYYDCFCIGWFGVGESYPPSYSCRGIQSCQLTNVTCGT